MAKQKRTKQKRTKRKKLKILSETKYQQLIKQMKGKKKMSLKDRKSLDKTLYIKYCKCLKKFESNNDTRGFPICMSSIYKNRGFKSPKNASKRCNEVFNKNVAS